jgi:hypothetical protein
MPLVVKDSTSEEVGYLIQELHISGRWPILVYNVSTNVNGSMCAEINKDEAYIILTSGPCEEWTEYISRFQQQLYELSAGNNTWHSWNPRAKFIVSVMSNCEQKENTEISRALLNELWLRKLRKLLSSSWCQMNMKLAICRKLQLFRFMAHTWKCTLGFLMRIHTDAIQLKALYV